MSKDILTQPVVAVWDLIPVARRGWQKSIQEICNGDADFSNQAIPAGVFGEIRTERTEAAGISLVSFVYVAM
jgi:hypothetical protein